MLGQIPQAVINLDALRHNLACVRTAAPRSRVMAVIKANGYGHGLLRVATALRDADPAVAERHTGCQVGGTSPFGLRKALPIYVERSILDLPRIYINGGRRGFLVALAPADLVRVGIDGHASGHRQPSSEWRFHRDIYHSRPEAGAVVHTHSAYATTFACLGKAIPAFHYEVAFAGGKDIRCAPYRTFCTQDLSDVALRALEGRKACLLAQHGLIAFGADLADALRLADKVEHLARIYWQALQVGELALLSDGEMALMAERFRHYGPRPG